MQNLHQKKKKKHAHNLLQFPAEINTIVGVKQTQTNLIFFLFTKKNIIWVEDYRFIEIFKTAKYKLRKTTKNITK